MILITGITGKSGTGLVEAMIKDNYKERFGVIVRETSNTEYLDNSGLNFIKHTGTIDDPVFMTNTMKGYDTVLHIAQKRKLVQIATVAANAGTIKHLILVSSTSLYSNYDAAAEILIAAEKEVHAIAAECGMAVTLIRPTMIFGMNDRNINIFIEMVDKLPICPIVKKGQALVQPIWYKDMGQALYLLIQNQEKIKGKEYIVSGDVPMKLIDMLMTISVQLEKKEPFLNVPMKLAETLVNFAYILSGKRLDYREQLFRLTEDRSFNHDLISEEFGYKPHPFKVGLQESIQKYKEK